VKSVIAFIVSMCIFGTIGAVIRFIELPSSEIALFRGLVGVICLAPFLLKDNRRGLWTDLKANGWILLLTGAALAGNWIFLFQAYRHTTIALAAISYYTAPVFVMALTPLLMKERLSLLKLVCVAFTLLGMILVIGVGNSTVDLQANYLGLIFGFFAAICYATPMLSNKFLRNLGGLETTVPQLFLAALFLFPYVLYAGEMNPLFQSVRSLLLLLVLGLVHTGVGFLFFFVGIKGLKTQEIAILNYLDPLTSVLISLIIFKEGMTIIQIAGAVLICAATLIGTINWATLSTSGAGLKR
jgi:drug/metabolite transporter (DMT)-like permease